MAVLESAPLSFFRLSFSSNPPLLFLAKSNLPFPISTTKSYPLFVSVSRNKFRVLSSAIQEEASVENVNLETRLFVLNLPWSYTVDELKNLFGECGTVEDAEIIRRKKDGKSRGYAFVTMGSREEAVSVIQKYDSYELMGRIIRVEFAKDSKKTSPAPPAGGKSYKLYVSNLAWKVRANHLRDLFAAEFNPTSSRVVFETPEGKSAGFGFVTFASKEEAESAISALNGKELLGRPITLAFSKRGADKTEDDNTPAETETAES